MESIISSAILSGLMGLGFWALKRHIDVCIKRIDDVGASQQDLAISVARSEGLSEAYHADMDRRLLVVERRTEGHFTSGRNSATTS